MYLLIEFESTDEAGPTTVEEVKQETLRRLEKAVVSGAEARGTWEVQNAQFFSSLVSLEVKKSAQAR